MITINGYQIIKVLGKGGMATVYLAEEESLDREVALKVLTIHLADETFKKSFLAEARLVAQLEHQHIIKIYRVNVENNQFYMEMELLREGTLKERLESTSLNISTILLIIKQIASALSYAHQKGYIHRDIKPANILFRGDDDVVLADFGIAKTEGAEGDLTMAGHIGFGTPNYMAPEQAMGEKVDGRTDMYSLGIVLYEMLTQERPFKATTTVAIIQKHIVAKVPALPPVYAYLQPVLDKALSKNKEERYVDVDAFSAALIVAHEDNENENYPIGDETRPYVMHEQARIEAGANTRGNVTKPWNIACKTSSELLVISFIDIVNSTKLSEKHGDFVFARDIRKNFERIIKENMLDNSEGVPVKFLGDGVMLIYSDPVYAIENSIRIQQAVKYFLANSKTPKFLLRIGLNIGGVTLENDINLDVQGIHVNKAQRVEGQCKPGLVAMSRSVYDIAHPRLKHQPNLFWKDIGEKKLKGIPDKERIHLVSPHKIGNKIKYTVIASVFFIALFVLIYSQPLLRDKLRDRLKETGSFTKNNFLQKADDSLDKKEQEKKEQEQEQEKKLKIAAIKIATLKKEEREEKELNDRKLKDAELKIKRLKEKEIKKSKEKKINDEKLKEAELKIIELKENEKIESEFKLLKIKEDFKNTNVILNSSFSIFNNMCMNYSSYKKVTSLYKGMKKMQDDYATGKSSAVIISSSKNTMRIKDKKEAKQELVIESFSRFIDSLIDLKTTDDNKIKAALNNFIKSKKMSLLLEKKFKKAINDEISGLDSSRGNNMNYYKKICN